MRLGMGLGREKLRGEERGEQERGGERGGERGREILKSWKAALVLSQSSDPACTNRCATESVAH